jgi:hypothetical protein
MAAGVTAVLTWSVIRNQQPAAPSPELTMSRSQEAVPAAPPPSAFAPAPGPDVSAPSPGAAAPVEAGRFDQQAMRDRTLASGAAELRQEKALAATESAASRARAGEAPETSVTSEAPRAMMAAPPPPLPQPAMAARAPVAGAVAAEPPPRAPSDAAGAAASRQASSAANEAVTIDGISPLGERRFAAVTEAAAGRAGGTVDLGRSAGQQAQGLSVVIAEFGVTPPASQSGAASSVAEAGAGGEARARGAGRGGRAGVPAPQPAPLPPAPRGEDGSLSAAVRWRIYGDGTVAKLVAGNANWQPVAIDPPAHITSGSAPSGPVTWLVGRAGAVFRSIDGATFTRVASPVTVDLVAVAARSATEATVTATDGRTFATTDGGQTWR